MRFRETEVSGAYVVELEPHEDERGFFARAFCVDEFAAQGIRPAVVQANVSYNRLRGTLRGLHYQDEPVAAARFFRCIRGAGYFVIVDTRPPSPTYLAWTGVELSTENRLALYVPELCPAGYQALADGTEAFYLVTAAYSADHERGMRYDDPAFAISWPLPVTALSAKDRSWPDLDLTPRKDAP